MTALLVTGTREPVDTQMVWENLDQVDGVDFLIVGDCPTGVDANALAWAKHNGVQFEVYSADWKRRGAAAGPRRNAAMVLRALGLKAEVMAFPAPGSRGTWDCVRKAKLEGLKVTVVPVNGISRT